MISPFHNVPLLHATYPGNTNDAKQFATIVESLKDRYRKLNPANSDVTLVFDKGNNSQENIEKLALEEPGRFHFVGSLRLNQCPELLMTPLGKYDFLNGEEFDKAKAFRTTKEVYGKNFTVIITDNPSLYTAQLRGVTKNIKKCNDKLKELTTKIILRNKGEVTKGRNYTVASVEKNVKDIISVEHMNKLYDYEISEDKNKQIILSWSFNATNFKQLKKQSFGKTILFTDRDEWATERIVSAYRAQYHVEDNFRQLKDTKVLSFRPIRHYTDHNIRVHAFYCVLALTLCCIMKLELEQLGHKMSIHKMIRDFINVTQSIVGFETNKKKIEKIAYPKEIPAHVSKYINHYQLKKYALKI
jgi:transposase